MNILSHLFLSLFLIFVTDVTGAALLYAKMPDIESKPIQEKMVPHKALYDVKLVATHTGSQIVNISGQMMYEWRPDCDGWMTHHQFNLRYDYADNPGMMIESDFTTYETYDGKDFSFSSRRNRNGHLYQTLRGFAHGGEKAVFTQPKDLSYMLSPETLFPMRHSVETLKYLRAHKKFFSAQVFDGSDEDGPIEINTFIGKPVNAMLTLSPSEEIDMTLINTPAYHVRMAVFPLKNEEEAAADYEMSMVLHDNGIISDMLIEYDDFSITQKLVALKKVEGAKHCMQDKKGALIQ